MPGGADAAAPSNQSRLPMTIGLGDHCPSRIGGAPGIAHQPVAPAPSTYQVLPATSSRPSGSISSDQGRFSASASAPGKSGSAMSFQVDPLSAVSVSV